VIFAASLDALLDALSLPPGVFTPREEISLRQHQEELLTAVKFGMWKSVTLLASQMVEAFLAKRMADQPGSDRDLRHATFGQLIRAAEASGILPDYDSPIIGVESISAALVIRNWSSHYTLWSKYPTELRATQAVALMLCALESLFPNDQRWRLFLAEGNRSPLLSHPPREIVKCLASSTRFDPLPHAIALAPDEAFDYIVAVGSLRTTLRLGHESERLMLPLDSLRRALTNRFGYLVLHAARANDKFLMSTISLLRKCGLAEQAQVFAVLLPFDARILAHLLRTRHPLRVTFYVRECHKAEPSLFASKAARNDVDDQLVPTFWRELAEHTDKLSVITRTLQPMPPRLLAQLMVAAPIELLVARLPDTSPRFAAMLLYTVRDSVVALEPKLVAVREALVDAVLANLRSAPLEQLHNVPVYFRLAKIPNDRVSLRVAMQILARMLEASPSSEAEWSSLRRAVWDTFIFIPVAAADALRVAQLLLAKYGESNWHLLCLRGMVEVARPVVLRSGRVSPPVLTKIVIPEDADRWQVYLALVAAKAISCQTGEVVPRALVNAAAAQYDRPPAYAPRVSHDLIDRVTVILAGLSAA
jgi:hypothetical protein